MQNSFFQAICRVGIFMICAQAIVHFRAQEAYEKYLKLLVSIMILIQLLMPVGSLFLGGRGWNAADALEQVKEEMERGMREAEKNAAAADEILSRMTLEEVRGLVEEQGRSSAEEEGGAEKDGAEKDGGIVGDIFIEEIDVKAIEPVIVDPVSAEE